MKRTFTANIDGKVFHIDEDAYSMLQTYLDQLRNAFGPEEGSEIVADIESRIRELFTEKLATGATVIVLADVDRVISTLGNAAEIAGDNGENGCDDPVTPPPAPGACSPETTPPPLISINIPKGKKLYRSTDNKVFGGVVGGLAKFLGWNANVMRLLLIVLFFGLTGIAGGWILLLTYLIAWMVIPVANTPIARIQAEGKAATIANVGAYTAELYRPDSEQPGFWSSFFSALGKIIIAFFGFCAALVAMGCLSVFIAIACALIGNMAELPNFVPVFADLSTLQMWATALWLLFGVLICTALAWGGVTNLLKLSPTSRTLKVTTLVIGMVLLVAAIVVSILATAA